MENRVFTSGNFQAQNRAFVFGDAVKVSFFVRQSQLFIAEECYFFLMASMRKMRMKIPMSYTLEFFQQLLTQHVIDKGFSDAVINFLVYRDESDLPLEKSPVSYYADIKPTDDVLQIRGFNEMDLIKEINVNTNLLSNIRVHCPENIYAGIYARENDLDDVILLNPQKRIARGISGNLLFLEENIVKIPKQSEGAYISPLMEHFVTYLHKNNKITIQEVEMIAFESQKAEEILMISDEKGLFSVTKIRNRTFGTVRFAEMIEQWKGGFAVN